MVAWCFPICGWASNPTTFSVMLSPKATGREAGAKLPSNNWIGPRGIAFAWLESGDEFGMNQIRIGQKFDRLRSARSLIVKTISESISVLADPQMTQRLTQMERKTRLTL